MYVLLLTLFFEVLRVLSGLVEFLRKGSVLFISQRPVESPNQVTDDDHGDGKAQNGSVPQFQESTKSILSQLIYAISLRAVTTIWMLIKICSWKCMVSYL